VIFDTLIKVLRFRVQKFQRTEVRGQITDSREQRTGDRKIIASSSFYHLSSVI
jgi:hypothetical protein